MTVEIQLGCGTCYRNDFECVTKLPNDWTDITEVCSYKSIREVAVDDMSRSPLDWQTHLGTCPDRQAKED